MVPPWELRVRSGAASSGFRASKVERLLQLGLAAGQDSHLHRMRYRPRRQGETPFQALVVPKRQVQALPGSLRQVRIWNLQGEAACVLDKVHAQLHGTDK